MFFKKRLMFLIILVMFCIPLAACSNEPSIAPSIEIKNYNVNFYSEGVVCHTISTAGTETTVLPENPVKEGYEFIGWFTDEGIWAKPFNADFLLNTPLTSDLSVYAKFEETVIPPLDNEHLDMESLWAEKSTLFFEMWKDSNYGQPLDVSIKTQTLSSSSWSSMIKMLTLNETIPLAFEVEENYIEEVLLNIEMYAKDSIIRIQGSNIFVTDDYAMCYIFSDDVIKEDDIYYNLEKTVVLRNNNSAEAYTTPDNIVKVNYGAFMGNNFLKKITLSDSLTSIEKLAFAGCNNLNEITLPFIGLTQNAEDNAYFYKIFGKDSSCIPESLTTVTITGGTSIGESAFSGCGNITAITIPESVTSIGDRAFSGCGNLTAITIPDSVTSIGDCAFLDCINLKKINIPSSVTRIGHSPFSGCNNIIEITLPFVGESLNVKEECQQFYRIFDFIANIPESLTTVTITGGTSIGKYAFYGCGNLTSITIPENISGIGEAAFKECSALKRINSDTDGVYNIPNSVIKIEKNAFEGCNMLTSITIQGNVTNIGDYAFEGCSNLSSVYIIDLSAWCGIVFIKCDSNPLYYAHNLYINNVLANSITIPDNVTIIRGYTFINCINLLSVTIPATVTSIYNTAFLYCGNLTSVYVNSTIPPSIGLNVFSDDSVDIKIYVPAGSVDAYKAADGWKNYTYYICAQ